MPRRKPPPPADVAVVLAPIRRAVRARDQAATERDDLIRAAARHDPRPTNRQIADAASVSEGAVRAVIQAR